VVALAVVAVATIPETVQMPEQPRWRISRPDVPPQVRATFIRAAIAGFAGFAMFGLFTAVAPSFLGKLLDEQSHALSGAVVCAVFAASTLGQAGLTRTFGRWALPVGCVGLIAGMGLLAGGLAAKSLGLVIGAAIVGGLGQGLSFRSGLESVNAEAPAERRGGVASSFFIVLYVAISLPVIGEGVAATSLGLQTAGIAFSVAVATLAAVALVALIQAGRRVRRQVNA
jgi:hypothetical protein